MILYFLSLVLFVMGLYCLVAKKNIVKKIIGITIIEYSINLFLILIGYRRGGVAPILLKGMSVREIARSRSAAAGARSDLDRDRARSAGAHGGYLPEALREVQDL